jgi:hypothetical protein
MNVCVVQIVEPTWVTQSTESSQVQTFLSTTKVQVVVLPVRLVTGLSVSNLNTGYLCTLMCLLWRASRQVSDSVTQWLLSSLLTHLQRCSGYFDLALKTNFRSTSLSVISEFPKLFCVVDPLPCFSVLGRPPTYLILISCKFLIVVKFSVKNLK